MHYRTTLGALCIAASAFPMFAFAAMLYIDPPEGTYGPGDTFVASIRVENESECINAAQVVLQYPRESLRAVDFSRGDSIFSLWIEEPLLNTETGIVRFAGGVPGGYCGRIQGDPQLSNILGKVIFTVLRSDLPDARIDFTDESQVLLNDGLGSPAELTMQGARFSIVSEALGLENPWLKEIREDIIAPDQFKVYVESAEGFLSGKYFIAFSTVDKQSGMDHFEIFERGVWKKVDSPYQLKDQYLRGVVELKAIDKAGNERLGEFVESSTTPRTSNRLADYWMLFSFIALLLLLGLGRWVYDRRKIVAQSPASDS